MLALVFCLLQTKIKQNSCFQPKMSFRKTCPTPKWPKQNKHKKQHKNKNKTNTNINKHSRVVSDFWRRFLFFVVYDTAAIWYRRRYHISATTTAKRLRCARPGPWGSPLSCWKHICKQNKTGRKCGPKTAPLLSLSLFAEYYTRTRVKSCLKKHALYCVLLEHRDLPLLIGLSLAVALFFWPLGERIYIYISAATAHVPSLARPCVADCPAYAFLQNPQINITISYKWW